MSAYKPTRQTVPPDIAGADQAHAANDEHAGQSAQGPEPVWAKRCHICRDEVWAVTSVYTEAQLKRHAFEVHGVNL